MARGAGEPSAKRAKVDEAGKEEEEDPLVRRKEELVRLLEKASAKGKVDARAKEELLTLCKRLEAKNEKLLGRLPPELWQKIDLQILDENLDQNDLVTLAMTCRFFREKQMTEEIVDTKLNYDRLVDLQKSGKVVSRTLGWFQWVCDTMEILPGCKQQPAWPDKRTKDTVYEGDLVNYAVTQGSVEILEWLMEEKGWELNEETDMWAGAGGSVEILEYLVDRGYKFDKPACTWPVAGGHLEALKFLRGLDPPCPWGYCPTIYMEAARRGHLELLKLLRALNPPVLLNAWPCSAAAREGHLDVLKWLRAQDPPFPWDEETCAAAACGGQLNVLKWLRAQDPPCPWDEKTCRMAAQDGHLEILKWARSQDPPCPWSRSECKFTASQNNHQHIINWIDLEEDESDVEYSYGEYSDRSYDSYGDDYF